MAKKSDSNHWDPWGGQTLFCMNFEYTVPIVKMLRIAAFSDVGSVGVDEFDLDFSDTFAWTVGIGFRIDIPMFPIRLDFATPIEEPDHAEKEIFSFTIGYDF
jgi:outer membrane protein assembly factor BamA